MNAEFSGALSERVEVQRLGLGRDAIGGADGAWVSLGPAWAAIEPLGDGDVVAGDALAGVNRWRVTLRTRDVAVGDRLLWRGRRLRVRLAIADPRTADRLILKAEEER